MKFFPMFRTNKADDIIRLLKLFKKDSLTDDTRRELAKSILALSVDLVAENWDIPMPPCNPSLTDEEEGKYRPSMGVKY